MPELGVLYEEHEHAFHLQLRKAEQSSQTRQLCLLNHMLTASACHSAALLQGKVLLPELQVEQCVCSACHIQHEEDFRVSSL